jgi:V/A-type H+-transporting ATPase subunit I
VIPIIVNKPESMLKLKVLAVKDERDTVLRLLQKIGVLHVESSDELTPVDKNLIENEKENINSLLANVSKMLSYADKAKSITTDQDTEIIYTRTNAEFAEEVSAIYQDFEELHETGVAATEKLKSTEETVRYVTPLSTNQNILMSDLHYTGKYLFARTVSLNNEAYRKYSEKIQQYLIEPVIAISKDNTVIYGVGSAADLSAFEALITEANGINVPAVNENISIKGFIDNSVKNIAELTDEVNSLNAKLKKKIENNFSKLSMLYVALVSEKERLAVLEKAVESKYAVMISGWVPDDSRETVVHELKDKIQNIYLDVRHPADGEEPPTKLKNKGGFRPFEIIVNLFGRPKYQEWDPTPIISYSFALFFGLMICDVIYAIGIALLAKFLLPKFVDDPQTDEFKTFQRLIYTCCGAGLIAGLLVGQYLGDVYLLFGLENFALSTTIKNLLGDPVTFIVISLGIGLVHVNIGYALALIKAVKNKDRWTAVNKVGIFLLQFGLPVIINSILKVSIPGMSAALYSILSYVMLAGIALIIISNLAINRGLGSFMWIFDLTGLLGDVMSYARLAGVGMATFYLASTFNMLTGTFGDLFGGPVGTVIGAIIGLLFFVFGHAINLLLGGITGFIHSLRLCFVEFLFKFYEGGGYQYKPFKIKKRVTV